MTSRAAKRSRPSPASYYNPAPPVEAEPVDPPALRESYICGFEAELDHLNFGQGNQGTTSGFATRVKVFDTESQQLEWADKLTDNATLAVPPRFHTTEDLENEEFRTNDSYKSFEGMLGKLVDHLFPAGVKVAQQKGQAAGFAMGLLDKPADPTPES